MSEVSRSRSSVWQLRGSVDGCDQRVEENDVDVKAAEPPDHRPADGAGADDADALARQLPAGEPADPLPLPRLDVLVPRDDAADECENHGKCLVGDRLGIHARRDRDADAMLAGGVVVDRIGTDANTGDEPEIGIGGDDPPRERVGRDDAGAGIAHQGDELVFPPRAEFWSEDDTMASGN